MGLRCSLLGHSYGETEIEREREEQGSEVVVTVREFEECERCGDRKVVTENKEVTALESPAPDLESAESDATADDASGATGGSDADRGPDSTDSPDASGGPDTTGGATATDSATATGGPAAGTGRAGSSQPDVQMGADADVAGDDAEIIGGSPESSGSSSSAASDSAGPAESNASSGASGASRSAGVSGASGSAGASDASGASSVGGSDAASSSAESDLDQSPSAADDDGVILDDDDEDSSAGGDDRTPGEWPDAETTHPAEADDGPGDWPAVGREDDDEGFDAGPADSERADVEFGGGLTPESAPEVDDDESEEVEFVNADGDTLGTRDSGASDTDLSSGISAGADAPNLSGPADDPDVDAEFVCPECDYREPVSGSSLRAGDICPECSRGYLAQE